MKFDAIERTFIQSLVNYDFSSTKIGYAFLEEEIINDKGFALLCPRIGNEGKYYMYFTKGIINIEENQRLLYNYVKIFQLINKLEEMGLITILQDNNIKKDPCFIFPNRADYNIKTKNNTCCVFKKRDALGYEIELSLDLKTGKWTESISQIKGRHEHEIPCVPFDNSNLPLEHFLYGMIYVSPDLRKLVDDEFETYEEKTLSIAQKSLTEAKNSVKKATQAIWVSVVSIIISVVVSMCTLNMSTDVNLINVQDSVFTKSDFHKAIEEKNSKDTFKWTIPIIKQGKPTTKNSYERKPDKTR